MRHGQVRTGRLLGIAATAIACGLALAGGPVELAVVCGVLAWLL